MTLNMRIPGDKGRATALWLVVLALGSPAHAGQDRPADKPATPDEASYDIGLVLGRQLYQDGLGDAARQDELVRGLKEGLAGKVATNEQRVAANQFIKTGRDAVIERNQREARDFLDRNAKAAGVHVTASGLQYRVLAAGDPAGHPPGPTDQVTVQYRAALADGVEFDSSIAHGRPAVLQMGSMLKGWREALLLMHPGAKWQLYLSPELTYGTNPPPAVPPGSLLIYDLELLRVEPPARLQPTKPPAGAGPPRAQ